MKHSNINRLFNEPFSRGLDQKREKARAKGRRLIYDCRNNQVYGNRISCRHGHALGRATDGTLALAEVLRGIAPAVCQKCKDYNE